MATLANYRNNAAANIGETTVSEILADKPFLFGERPATIDAVAYGFLANLLLVPVETELKRLGEDLSNLRPWCEAIEAGLFARPPAPRVGTPTPSP